MRKGNMTILTSVFVMALVAAGIGMGTMAYFSDVEMSTGNTFTAGTIDIAVDDQNPWKETFYLEDLKPCEVRWIKFIITNVGTNELEVWKHIEVIEYLGGLHPESEVDEDHDDTINDIGKVIGYDMKIDGVVVIDEADGYTVDGLTGVACYWIYLGVIPVGGSMTVEQSYHLKPDVTNWAQGDVMVFDIELFAQQTVSNPPAPANEHPVYCRGPA